MSNMSYLTGIATGVIATIILGLVVNLLWHEVEKPYDRLATNIRNKIFLRSQAKQQEIERILGLMESDSILVTTIYVREMRASHGELIVMLVVGGLLFVVWSLYQSDALRTAGDQLLAFLLLILAVLFMATLFYLTSRSSLITEAIRRYERAHPMGEIKKKQ